MGAFGTAFTLATNIDVLPMLIYTEFTLSANIAMAAALSVGLGLVAWAALALARSFAGAHRRGGRVTRMRERLIFAGQLLFTLLVAAFLIVPGGPVDAGRRYRQLFPRHPRRASRCEWVVQVWELYADTIARSLLIALAHASS